MYNFYLYDKKGEIITWGKLPACGILDELTKTAREVSEDGWKVGRLLLAQDASVGYVPNVLDYKWNGAMFSEIKRKG